jgi:hypothetical protein
MIFLLDQIDKSGEMPGVEAGQLLTPLTCYRRWSDAWAIDNGAFSGFREAAFVSLLEREKTAEGCLFVCCPDIVGNARRTLEVFDVWQTRIQSMRYPVALVLQDGIEDLEIPWARLQAVFVGGSTEFKGSKAASDCARAARMLGKWVHVGRVNTPIRYDYWKPLADSCDGSGVSRFTHMRRALSEGLPLLAEAVGEATNADQA